MIIIGNLVEVFMEVKFYSIGSIDEKLLKFAVISTRYEDKWLLVRHKERSTWEIPGGHREEVESIYEAATRELFEETGAKEFDIEEVCEYSVTIENNTSYGRLFFAKVKELGELPHLEIAEIKLFEELPDNLTYPDIMPYLQQEIIRVRSLNEDRS
jgi:8-oxo-dGTP diphosphatase